MAIGTVDTVDPDSGHGTINPDRHTDPIPFEADPQRPALSPGDRVSYSVQLTPTGSIARGVHHRP